MTDAHDAKAREVWDRIMAANPDDPADGVDEWGALLRIATALRDCEREALERAAKVAESVSEVVAYDEGSNDYRVFEGCKEAGIRIAARIRALAQEEPGPPDKVAGEA